jgi:hypothetical protein
MAADLKDRESTLPEDSFADTKMVSRLEELVARRWVPCFAFILTLSVFLVGVTAAFRPLEHDEIFTFYVASQSSLRAVYSALLLGADNHPPIDYWMRHLSMGILGPGALAFRLPSILAFAGSTICVFTLAKRNFGSFCALIAASVIIASQASSLGYYARSYSCMLLWSILALLLWRMYVEGKYRLPALILLAILFASALSLHFYAPFQMVAVGVAELVRSVQRRSIDWRLWLAFSCSALSLPVVVPLIPFAQSMSAHFWSPVTIQAALAIYAGLFVFSVPAIFFVLVLWALMQWWIPNERKERAGLFGSLPAPELWAMVYLCALPVVIFVVAKSKTGALQGKYAISSVIGVAILTAFAASRARGFRVALLLVLPAFALSILASKAVAAVRAGPPGSEYRPIYGLAEMSDIPVVLDSSQTFLQASYYAPPDILAKLFFLVDRDTVIRYGHEDVDHIALPGLARIAPIHVAAREAFIHEHPVFLFVYEGGWLLRRLSEQHASLTVSYLGNQPVFRVDTSFRAGAQ